MNEMLVHPSSIEIRFAKSHPGKYSDSIPNADNFYPSSDMYDDMAYAAIWLYSATGHQAFLNDSLHFMSEEFSGEALPHIAFDWDAASWGASMMIAAFTKDVKHVLRIQYLLDSWLRGTNGVKYTPQGLAWTGNQRGVFGRTASTVFLAAVYAHSTLASPGERDLLTCFAHKQMGYILGDTGKSFVVGYGTTPPCRPHHQGASCQMYPAVCNLKDYHSGDCNPHTLYGALVSGPGSDDAYLDAREEIQYNDVAINFNAGYTGVLASLMQYNSMSRVACIQQSMWSFPINQSAFRPL